jgi:Flp pilus assembly pilin Flp
MSRLVVRLLRDDSGVTSLQYFVAAVGLAVAAVVASRPIAGVLASFLYRIHIIATLAMH